MKTIKITESQYNDILNDPLLDNNNEPENFSLKVLRDTYWEDSWELIAYCDRCGLSRLGNGIGRIVYALDDRLVLKIINGNGNYRQNESEVFSFTEMSPELREMVPVIFAYDKNHTRPMWIISERVLTATYADFTKILGFTFGGWTSNQDKKDEINDLKTYEKYQNQSEQKKFDLCMFLDDYEYNRESFYGEYKEIIKNSHWIQKLLRILNRGFVGASELTLINNWGLVQRNGKPCIVILDIGM